jgi:DNA polymerase delta subunit 1
MESEELDSQIEIGQGPENSNTSQRWSRPELPVFESSKDPIIFQQIDIDHYIGKPIDNMPGAKVYIY